MEKVTCKAEVLERCRSGMERKHIDQRLSIPQMSRRQQRSRGPWRGVGWEITEAEERDLTINHRDLEGCFFYFSALRYKRHENVKTKT